MDRVGCVVGPAGVVDVAAVAAAAQTVPSYRLYSNVAAPLSVVLRTVRSMGGTP